MEEYIQPELSGIFSVKMVTKNKVHRSAGTYFMHMRVKTKGEILDDETRNFKT